MVNVCFSCEESAETLDGELAESLDEEKPKVEDDFEKVDEPIVENDFEKADEPIVENDFEKVDEPIVENDFEKAEEPIVENDFEKMDDEPGIFQILDRLEKATDNLLSR